MTISRWKVMAGVLGVSVGGLAIAGQFPKPGETSRRVDEPLVAADMPKAPGGSAPAVKPPALDVPPPGPAAVLPPLPSVPEKLEPAKSSTKPTDLPALPQIEPSKPADAKKPEPPKPEVIPVGGAVLPALPSSPAVEPAKPALPPMADLAPPKAAADPGIKPLPNPPATPPVAVEPSKPVEFTRPTTPPAALVPPMADPLIAPSPAVETKPVSAPSVTTAPVVAAAVGSTKFRIVLRVGEGEPTFEVRHGDDLVMKVKSDKVDIKSPEKGQGLSAVTATGKVKFVGFGAEGTCDTFSFLAGTGEVLMTGNVNVKVRDKIGRVESELTTEKMQYKLDSSSLPGVLKP